MNKAGLPEPGFQQMAYGSNFSVAERATLLKLKSILKRELATTYERPESGTLNVTATTVNSGFRLEWAPVPGAKRYLIYRGTTTSFSASKLIATIEEQSEPGTRAHTDVTDQFAVATFPNLYYWVRAVDDIDEGPISAMATVTNTGMITTGLQTSVSNPKVVIDSSGISGFNGAGAETFDWATATGVLTATAVVLSGLQAGSDLDGQYLTGNSVVSSKLNLAARGWTQTSAFSVTDADTVAWGAGTFTASDGTAYSIGAGNTGNMAAKTYVYLDIAVSTTAYQSTTTAATAVGDGKVLIAVCQNNTTEAVFQVFGGIGGINIDANNIVANSITSNELATGSVTAGKIDVTDLSAINADMGSITAGDIVLPSGGFVRSGQTAYDTGTGFYLGNDGGTPKFSIGNASADKLTWDGSTLAITGDFEVNGDAGNIQNGTYTPTLTGTTNIEAVTADVCHYLRIGDVVLVTGTAGVDVTSSGAFQFRISLPFASSFTNFYDCSGVVSTSSANLHAGIYADITNDEARVEGTTTDVNNQAIYFSFTYNIL